MQNRYRWFSAVIVAVVCAVSSPSVSTRAIDDGSWEIGDLFVGVGWMDYLPGQYWAFDGKGEPKLVGGVQQKIVDTWPTVDVPTGQGNQTVAMPQGVTTGCMVDPTGLALHTTSFHSLTVSKFLGSPTNGAVVGGPIVNNPAYTALEPVQVDDTSTSGDWPLFAIETIVFDAAGNYYVGGQGQLLDPPFDNNAEFSRPSFILKYNAANALQTIWEVPSGANGVDQLDLGTTELSFPTLYYTSEDTKIYIFRAWLPADDPRRFSSIQLVNGDGTPLEGTLYAVRALPPRGGIDNDPDTEEDETKLPSGFLVASSTDVLRVDLDGKIVKRYAAAGISGQRFALNITPDGGSFWTATYPGGGENYPPSDTPVFDEGKEIPNAVGYLLKYHIATGFEQKRVQLAAGGVWGLCLLKEYTAALNTCYVTDAEGRTVDADRDGNPDTKACSIPPVCDPGRREECTDPVSLPNQNTRVDTAVSYRILENDTDRNLKFELESHLPTGLFMDDKGLVTGTPTLPIDVDELETTVSVVVTDQAGGSSTASFLWRVYRNNPPDCGVARPTQVLWPPNHKMVQVGILGVTDADGDPITISVTEIRQDEPVLTQGSGNTAPDGAITGSTAWVRAERTGKKGTPGNGRIYEIFFEATDGKDTCTGVVVVGVPHDQGKGKPPLPNPGRWNSLTGLFIIP